MTEQNPTAHPSWPVFSSLIPLVSLCVGAPAAIACAYLYGLPLQAFVGFYVMAHVAGFGVTLGLHRLFTHRSFQTPPPVEWALMVCGCMSGQSSPFFWVATHRQHHRHSDRVGDPHSPNERSAGRCWLGRFWHAHQGWTRGRASYQPALIPDLLRRRDLAWIDRHWYAWYLLGLALPAAVGYLVGGTAYDALMGLLWGGLFRQAFTEQVTYAINSVCHVWGSRPYATGEYSRNNAVLGVLGLGEGWHNNHHAHPYSARYGFRWWQSDMAWTLLWLMERVGLVWNVKRPKFDTHALKGAPTAEVAEAAPVAAEF